MEQLLLTTVTKNTTLCWDLWLNHKQYYPSVCNSTESDKRQILEGLIQQLYTFAVCFLRSNFNLLEKKKKISSFCADCTFLHSIFCQLCVLCHNNLLEITIDYSNQNTVEHWFNYYPASVSPVSLDPIIGKKKGLPVSYHIQHHLLLCKSIILTRSWPNLEGVCESRCESYRWIQNGHQAGHMPGLPPHCLWEWVAEGRPQELQLLLRDPKIEHLSTFTWVCYCD